MSNIAENSKPMNYFNVVRKRQNRELSNALLKACEYITVECSSCPLNEKKDCAGNKMPPKPFEEDRHSICTDWLGIYFRNLVQNKMVE